MRPRVPREFTVLMFFWNPENLTFNAVFLSLGTFVCGGVGVLLIFWFKSKCLECVVCSKHSCLLLKSDVQAENDEWNWGICFPLVAIYLSHLLFFFCPTDFSFLSIFSFTAVLILKCLLVAYSYDSSRQSIVLTVIFQGNSKPIQSAIKQALNRIIDKFSECFNIFYKLAWLQFHGLFSGKSRVAQDSYLVHVKKNNEKFYGFQNKRWFLKWNLKTRKLNVFSFDSVFLFSFYRFYWFSNVNNALGKDEKAMILRQEWHRLRLWKDCSIFSSIFWIKKKNILPGLCLSNE